MTIESVIYNRLQAVVSGRVYPQKFPQDAVTPAVRYQLIARDRPECMGASSGLVRSTYQFDLIADINSYNTTLTTLATLQGLLSRWRDSDVDDSFIVDEQEFYDDETEYCRWTIRVEIIHA